MGLTKEETQNKEPASQISKLSNQKSTQKKNQGEENSLRDVCDNTKHFKIDVIRILKEKRMNQSRKNADQKFSRFDENINVQICKKHSKLPSRLYKNMRPMRANEAQHKKHFSSQIKGIYIAFTRLNIPQYLKLSPYIIIICSYNKYSHIQHVFRGEK